MVGIFPKAKLKSYIIVVIDYFPKWIEAKAMASSLEFQVIKFLMSSFISRYVIPNILTNDNGPQFSGKELKWFW